LAVRVRPDFRTVFPGRLSAGERPSCAKKRASERRPGTPCTPAPLAVLFLTQRSGVVQVLLKLMEFYTPSVAKMPVGSSTAIRGVRQKAVIWGFLVLGENQFESRTR